MDAGTPVTINLTLQETELLLNAAGRGGTWAEVNPVMAKVISQVNAQVAPKPEASPANA